MRLNSSCALYGINQSSAGKELQIKAEKEAADRYEAGLKLLQELEANDKKRAAAA